MTDSNIDRMVALLRADFAWFKRPGIEDQKRMLARYVERIQLKHTDPLRREVGVQLFIRVQGIG